jgi:hypothetical protein
VALAWTTNDSGGNEMDSEVQGEIIATKPFVYGEPLALKSLMGVV